MLTSLARGLVMSAASGVGAAHFDNAALRSLRVSPDFHGPPRQVPGAHYVRTRPQPLDSPRLVAKSQSALELVQLGQLDDDALATFLSGNELLPGSEPAAHCCARRRPRAAPSSPRACALTRASRRAPPRAAPDCGHQFGAFAGQLGDGAAMYLGEVVSARGRWELQLKGAGPTPFSRTADGRKVLRSSIREFLASEAMHFLGIPSTRAAACVTSASTVQRDVLYSGDARPEPCAVVARVARTFVRFGSFEVCRPTDGQTGRAGPSAGLADGADLLRELVDYVCELQSEQLGEGAPGRRLAESGARGSAARAAALLDHAVESTAALVARWQGVGFTHGVLNTDNMGILGDSLDYGPYGFMENFRTLFVPNGSDNAGRYSYGSQPSMAEWNVRKLGEALQLAGLLEPQLAKQRVGAYAGKYERAHLAVFRNKLGLTPQGESGGGDAALVERLLAALQLSGADMSGAFLALGPLPRAALAGALDEAALQPILARLEAVGAPLGRAAKLAKPRMPVATLRQILALAGTEPSRLAAYGIDADFVAFTRAQLGALEAVTSLASDEEKRQRDRRAWLEWLQAYGARLATEPGGAEVLAEREARMAASNPAFVLREHLLQAAIVLAEAGDHSAVRALLTRAERPYLARPVDEAGWSALLADLPSDAALDIVLT